MSAECHLFTVSYWLMMSFSEAIVTQTEGYNLNRLSMNGSFVHNIFKIGTVPNVTYSGAFSAFSRYAGIYGL
jgi:hypothetical protein